MKTAMAVTTVLSLALAGCGGSAGSSSASATDSKPLRAAALGCYLDPAYGVLGDDNTTLTLDGKGQQDSDGLTVEEIGCVLKALAVTDAVVSHISDTRALDGMQTDSWTGYKARWTYHPDSGLNMIIQQD